MKTIMTTCLLGVLLSVSSLALASSQVEIEWENPTKYRDVKPVMESKKRFRESTFKRLDEFLQKLGTQLPDDNKLVLVVTDLDLAGQVLPSSFVGFGNGMSDVRVVKRVDIPRMSFSYQLLSKSGKVLQQSEVDLKDMSFMSRSNLFFKNETLRYEKNMLKHWFKEEFSEFIASDTSNS